MSDSKLLKGILNRFTAKKPNFLVIEIVNNYLQITLLRADFENKNITVQKNWIKKLEKPDIQYLLREIKKILKKIPKKSGLDVILNFDSSLAMTVYSSVSLVRPNSKELIDEADLDNLISHAIWRFFDRQRPKAAKKMNIEEIEVLLSDVRIRDIKVDGHKIINPLGFNAKSVEIYLSETFVVRNFAKGIREIISDNKIIFVSEAGTTLLHTLFNASKDKTEPLFLVNLFPDQTAVFQASARNLHYIDSFNWGENSLVNNLKEKFRLDGAAAMAVIDIYNKNTGSPHFSRRLENILMEEGQILANGIESLAPESGTVYINPYFDLPACLISDRFESRFNKNFKVRLLSTDSVMKNYGFTLQFNKSVEKINNPATLVSVLLELSLMPTNEKISYLANRRVRWLLS